MNKAIKTSKLVLALAIAASIGACVADPYSQQQGQKNYTPPAQSSAQPTYVQPQYVQQSYESVSQAERMSVSQGTCDRRALLLLAPNYNGAPGYIVGAAAGPLVGGAGQPSMAPADQGCVGQALEYAQTNQTIGWQNPDNGAQYQVTPLRAYQAQNGANCWEYTTLVVVNGQSQRIGDTACRQMNGIWQLQS
jgi:surface antigen